MPVIRIKVELPKPIDHEKMIAMELKKNAIIDKVNYLRAQYGFMPFECTYGEKKYGSIDKSKLEKDLKTAVGKLGCKIR